LSALRAAPEIVRLARPTSITVDLESRMMRVTEASQASRSTVVEETGMGRELHIRPWRARQPKQRLERGGDLEVSALRSLLRNQPGVKCVQGEIEQGIRHALFPTAVVVLI
jgi:hypothetical protein